MKIIFFLYRLVLSLRYRVKVFGHGHLDHDGPLLILPNHIALVDPRILITYLGKYVTVSPVASEKYYNMPVLKQVMDSVGTVPIGDMRGGASAEEVKAVFGKITDALKDGKSILIYPAGEIYKQGFESIKGKQSAYTIAQDMPENTKVIGIQTRGLWGSMRSMSWNNWETGIGGLFGNAVMMALANLIFFLPKRDVHLYVSDITELIKENKTKTLNEFNEGLEKFYNGANYHPSFLNILSRKEKETAEKMGEIQEIKGKDIFVEKVNYIKHFFYFDDVSGRREPELIEGSIKDLESSQEINISDIPEEAIIDIAKKIVEMKENSIPILNSFLSSKRKEATDIITQNLILDFYFDSLDLAEIKSFVQSKFEGASNPPINTLKTIGDLAIMAVGKSASIEKLKDCNW